MSRGPLIALGGGLLGALLFLSVRTGTPVAALFMFLSPVPLFAVGLSQGFPAALIAGATALAAVAVAAWGSAILIYLLCIVLPVMIVMYRALLSRPGAQAGVQQWYPPGLMLGWLTSYGLIVLVGAIIWYIGVKGGLEGAIRANLADAFKQLSDRKVEPQLGALLDMVARYLAGAVISTWLLATCVSATLAQYGLTRAGRALRPTPRYSMLTLPRWMGFVFGAAVVMAMLPAPVGTFGRNAVIILTIPFLLAGLAVIHALSGYAIRRPAAATAGTGPAPQLLLARSVFLGLVYVMLIRFAWPALFIVILGIVDQWVLLRRRFAPPGTGREDE